MLNTRHLQSRQRSKLRFGERSRKMRQADHPSDDLVVKLEEALDADADESLLLAKKIPAQKQEAGIGAA